MPRHSRTKLVPPKLEPEKNQTLEIAKEFSVQKQKEEPILTELDNETECPRCHEIMELQSSFDKLMYSCESCNFLLRCI
jgi:hypothetical protein